MAQRNTRAATPAPAPVPTAPDPGRLYTFAEAAPLLRLGESTLRRLVRTGEIGRRHTTRIGGKLFMTGAQITAVIEAGQGIDDPPPAARAHRRRRAGAA